MAGLQDLPVEVLEMIVDHLNITHEDRHYFIDNHTGVQKHENGWDVCTVKGGPALKPYRLVCRSLCKATNPAFFRRRYCSITNQGSTFGESRSFLSLQAIARSDHVTLVRELILDFSTANERFVSKRSERYRKAPVDKLVDCLREIPLQALNGFGNLRSFELRGPTWEVERDRDPLIVRIDMIQHLSEIARSSLRHLPPGKLEGLRLEMPSTSCLTNVLCDEDVLRAAQGVHSLLLTVCDKSGPGGERFGRLGLFWGEEAESFPRSTLQRYFPNESFQTQRFLKSLGQMHNLRTLSISATHFLDLDLLDSSGLRLLEILHLSRFKASPKILIDLFSQNRRTLKRVSLQEIDLKCETWVPVFLSLLSVEHLEDFAPQCLNYWEHGSSAGYRMEHGRMWEDMCDLESEYDGDQHALGDLQRLLRQRWESRGRPRSHCQDVVGESFIDLPSFEEWKSGLV